MSASPARLYEFGPFRLESGPSRLLCEGMPVPLPRKALETLVALVERGGRVVSREELIEAIWPDAVVEENNLSVNVSILRKALGESGGGEKYIETVSGRGYRFNPPAGGRPVERHTSRILSGVRFLRSTRWPLVVIAAVVVSALALGAGSLRRGWQNGDVSATNRAGAAVAPARLVAVRSLAVLPFRNVAAGDYGARNTSVAGELADSLMTRLGASRSVKLTPTGAVLKEKMTPNNLLLAGRALEADAVLTGVLFHGEPEEVYLRLHLVSVNGGEVLWAATFRHPRSEPASLLDTIARGVGEGLERSASRQEYERRAARHTSSREAWQLYLQGRFIWEQRHDVFAPHPLSFDVPALSIDQFERALVLDPGFALAHVGLADHYKTFAHSSDRWRRAEEHALEAAALDPTLAEARATLGFIRMFHYRDWAGAQSHLLRALELDPGCVTAHQWYALFHSLRGEDGEAIKEIMQASELAPFSLSVLLDKAEMQYHARRSMSRNYNIAAASALHAHTLHPSSPAVMGLLMRAYWMDGSLEAAVALPGWQGSPRDFARHRAGPRKGSRGYDEVPSEDTYYRARWHAWLNQREEALDLLERAYHENHFFMIYLEAEPFFDTLREEPRFQALVRKIGLGESTQEPGAQSPLALDEAA